GFVELSMAASMAGLVLVPLNFRLAQPEVDFILDDSGASLLFAGAGFNDMAHAAMDAADACEAVIDVTGDGRYGGWIDSNDRWDGIRSPGSAVLYQLYTSGTTGHPKGALITHDNVLTVCRNGIQFLGPFTEQSRSLVAMPLFHVAGNGWLFFGLAAGCPSTLVVDLEPDALLDTIGEQGITCTLIVPAVIQMLVLNAEAKGITIRGLKTIVFGASPMPSELLLRAKTVFPETDFIHVYGMTETTCMFGALDPAQLDAGQRLESCGRPFPDAEVRIMGADGQELAVGEVGEISCRTPQMMVGYWNRPEATAAAIRDGWYWTGDAGFVDDEGYLFICDRIKDMLISGGENVYPAEVENAVLAHPAVAEVAVIGVPDEKWGEAGLAVIVTKGTDEVSDDEIKATVRERLAAFKVPKHIARVEALPRNGAGKVTKQELRDRFTDAAH
ncbi:MAG: AMP-binding protein, partial [Acidimicrobiales bacterium]